MKLLLIKLILTFKKSISIDTYLIIFMILCAFNHSYVRTLVYYFCQIIVFFFFFLIFPTLFRFLKEAFKTQRQFVDNLFLLEFISLSVLSLLTYIFPCIIILSHISLVIFLLVDFATFAVVKMKKCYRNKSF